MRKQAILLAIIATLAALMALPGCMIFGIGAEAEVEITGHSPTPGNPSETVTFTVTNTGKYDLIAVDMEFKVTCSDGTSYRDSWSIFDLPVGASVSDEVWVETQGDPVETAELFSAHWHTW